ncbi:MFS general substrate transporter [Wilcoxina mikolae CBS 423.85]|nr:MFS general substrate transporter [Wilcoxina mikolae CBS 423.85]
MTNKTNNAATKFSPYTIRQLFILSLCRFAEPIALTSIFPYLYYMVKSFGVHETDISYYAGITAASFSLSQFFTGVLWGRLSDVVGRKPVILVGLLGTLTSLIVFGFSTTLPMAICARALSGLVNGNVGILRTMVAEMVPQKQLQPRAFSIMPLVWNVASIMGPIIGGFLSDPLKNHPGWFHGSRPAFFEKFPFALPNLVCASFFLIGLPIGFLFLDETLEGVKDRPDLGRALGRKLTTCISGRNRQQKDIADENTSLLSDSGTDDCEAAVTPPPKTPAPTTMREAFTFQSTMNVVYYVFLALHSITFDQLLPVFLSYPPQDRSEWQIPLKFAGGFGLSSSTIGRIFSVYGITGMTLQFFLFPPVTNWLGSRVCLRYAAFTLPVIYGVLPFVLLLPLSSQMTAIYVLMFFKSLAVTFAFPCSTILLTNSAPSLRVLGTLNGFAVSIAALGRAAGPAIGGLLFSRGQKTGYLIMPWLILAGIGFVSAFQMLLITDKGGIGDREETAKIEEEEEDEEQPSITGYGSVSHSIKGATGTRSDGT